MSITKEKVTSAMKWTALTVLPAVTTAWLALGTIWGLPNVQPIGATLTTIDAFLGTILGITAQDLAKSQSDASAAETESLKNVVTSLQAQVNALSASKVSSVSKAESNDEDQD